MATTTPATHAVPAAPAPERSTELTRFLVYFVLLGTIAAFAWYYRQAFYLGEQFPHNTFLFSPSGHYSDMEMFYGLLRDHNPYHSQYAVYPPFAYIVMDGFQAIGYAGTPLAWAVIAVTGVGGFVARQLDFLPHIDRVFATLALTLATYPFIFSFDRLNLEMVVTVLLAGFAYCVQTRRIMWAAVLVGVMAAMKGYPIVFAALFLVRGQWRAIAVCVVVAVVLTFLGSIFYSFDLPHTISLLRHNLSLYNETYVVNNEGLGWGISLYGPLKLLAVDQLGITVDTLRTLIKVYEVVSVVLLAGVVVALWRLPLKLWEQIALLTIAFDVLPTVSADYKLLHLVIPMALFLREGGNDRRRWWYLIGFALLMIPKSYILLRDTGVSIAVVINPLIMLAMAILIVISGLERRRGTSEPAADYALA